MVPAVIITWTSSAQHWHNQSANGQLFAFTLGPPHASQQMVHPDYNANESQMHGMRQSFALKVLQGFIRIFSTVSQAALLDEARAGCETVLGSPAVDLAWPVRHVAWA